MNQVNNTINKVIIIGGAGPAGLTAAFELQKNSHYKIILVEASNEVGGISKTVDFKGNKIDIGGHRFFSKSKEVINWWEQFLPIVSDKNFLNLNYQGKHTKIRTNVNEEIDGPHFKVRPRKSRIYYKKHLFDYPVKINFKTFSNFGLWKTCKIVLSLLKSRISPIIHEKNLEDFYINRFGKELYETFFKEYTKKVWGKNCNEIGAEWGRQRIKDVSITKLLSHYFTKLLWFEKKKFGNNNVEQSLTEFFLYPEKGPGELWEEVTRKLNSNVTLLKNNKITSVVIEKGRVASIVITDNLNNNQNIKCDYFISSIPIKHLIKGIGEIVPYKVKDIASKLQYRDFIIVGLLMKDLKKKNKDGSNIKDNWLYIQNDEVLVGRVQLFHNWSDKMVKNKEHFWIGAEFFCNETDNFWNMDDNDIIEKAKEELSYINLIEGKDFLDGVVIRTKKAYPSYTGSYNQFDEVKNWLNTIPNLFPIGRNGMHKYNNQDHSMLTAMLAAKNIINGELDKTNLWKINTEDEYLEELTKKDE